MRGCRRDHDDLLARKQSADPVDDGDILQRPALPCLGFNPLQLALRHPGKMFQRHRRDAVIAAQPPHRSDKQRDAAYRLGLQGAALFANIEIFGLHTNRHGSSPGDGWEKGHLVAG